MVEGIQNHIGSLNWGYRSALGDKGVKYINGRASFIDPHTIKVCTCYIAIRYRVQLLFVVKNQCVISCHAMEHVVILYASVTVLSI